MTTKERKIFKQYAPYGCYITSEGERILFNRNYQPIEDNCRYVDNIIAHEFYYDDSTPEESRIYNSLTKTVIRKNYA